MRTVKLVVVGSSGVGKTSLRNQYIAGRFTTGYRATIGADFITKTLPHYSNPEESVVLQIWDTAGQERFSSLSSAFFRGADAVLLMFDVNQPNTLEALKKWWSEFKDRAPVPDEDEDKFCTVVVGNKIDATPENADMRVTETKAQQFIDELIPPPSVPPSPELNVPSTPTIDDIPPLPLIESEEHPSSNSIDIGFSHLHHHHHHKRRQSVSRSRSRSTIFRGGTMGTMTTTHTIYHTPSSSMFDNFESARTSPTPTSSFSFSRSPSHSPVRSPRRVASMSSTSSVPTITPSLFIRGQAETACTTPIQLPSLPPLPERRPKLFFTSAKTGESVSDVFEYIARRVVVRWEYEEAVEARTLHVQDTSVDDIIRIGYPQRKRPFESWAAASSCCGS